MRKKFPGTPMGSPRQDHKIGALQPRKGPEDQTGTPFKRAFLMLGMPLNFTQLPVGQRVPRWQCGPIVRGHRYAVTRDPIRA
jgi:hypothetical protein